MLNPKQLTITMVATFSALKVDHVLKLKVKHEIEAKKKELLLQFDFTPKMAPIIHPETIMQQAKTIWTMTDSMNPKKIIARKQAALIYVLSALSMRRWIDICRLKWTDVKWINKSHGRFLLIRIHVSKSNAGEKIEEVTLAEQPTNWGCPFKLLIRFWRMKNEPRSGFIFQCPNRFDKASCAGHRKMPCLGHETGDNSLMLVTRIAKELKWKNVPTRHTGRRTGIAMASLYGIPKERILEATGWVSQTDMLRHYTAATQSTREDGIANLYAKELEKDKPFEKFDQIYEK